MLSLLSACATDSVLPESPEITVKGVDILELGLDRQRFQFNLNAYNPNKFGLPLNGVSFNLKLSDVEVGQGFSDQSITLASQADTIIPVEVETSLVETLDDFKNLLLSGGLKPEYEMSGNLKLVGESIGIPFTVQGKLLE